VMVATQALSSFRKNISADRAWMVEILIARPLHVPLMVLVVSTLTCLYTLPSLPFAVFCQFLFSALNDTSVTLLNEMVATSVPPEKFKKSQAVGQALRRLGNMITAFTGPVLFNVAPWLPFAFYGLVVFCWGLFVWQALYWRALEVIPATTGEDPGYISAFRPCIANKKWHDFEREFNIRQQELLADYAPASQESQVLRYYMAQVQAQNCALQCTNSALQRTVSALHCKMNKLEKLVHSSNLPTQFKQSL